MSLYKDNNSSYRSTKKYFSQNNSIASKDNSLDKTFQNKANSTILNRETVGIYPKNTQGNTSDTFRSPVNSATSSTPAT